MPRLQRISFEMMDDRSFSEACPEFIPLYQEHTAGLQFTEHLRKAVQRGVPVAKIKQYSIWFWQHHIKPHFFQEEHFLLPFLEPDEASVVHLCHDHREIRDSISKMISHVSPGDFLMLATLLEEHIRFEEQQFLPAAAATLAVQIREEIHRKLLLYPVNAGVWEDEFWNG